MAEIDYNRPFAWTPLNFRSVAAFRAYIAALNLGWAQGVTLHHTWKPTRSDWRGLRSMDSLRRHYLGVENGTWDSAPHFFIAPDGIWQGTPPTRPGIHAGPECNRERISFEIVGDYDREPWPSVVQAVVFGCVDAVLDQLGLDVGIDTVNGHRECGSPKTCPGKMIDMDEVRAALKVYRGDDLTEGSVPDDLPPGTYPVAPILRKAWEDSGGVWNGVGVLTPGYALEPAHRDAAQNVTQRFERGVVRLRPDGRVEWLLLSELVS